jgi:hypothetical protein
METGLRILPANLMDFLNVDFAGFCQHDLEMVATGFEMFPQAVNHFAIASIAL